jgi:hypothetical protein
MYLWVQREKMCSLVVPATPQNTQFWMFGTTGRFMAKEQPSDQHSEKETKRRMDDALRRALNTPPKPHKDIAGKGGKSPKPPTSKGRNFRHQGR